jgi:hypothetical protein
MEQPRSNHRGNLRHVIHVMPKDAGVEVLSSRIGGKNLDSRFAGTME